MNKFKKGMIVVNEFGYVSIVLEVTDKDIKRGVNADKPGLYGFYGMWYGRDRNKQKSFGKIQYLDGSEQILYNNTLKISNKQLHNILGYHKEYDVTNKD